MTANQRRPGFRLPWSSDPEPSSAAGEPATGTPAPEGRSAGVGTAADVPAGGPSSGPAELPPRPRDAATAAGDGQASAPDAVASQPKGAVEAARAPVAPSDAPVPTTASAPPDPEPEPPLELMHELVAAMRRVAEEARQAGIAEARSKADARVRELEADGERRRAELRSHAEADIAAVAAWASAEAERIKLEAEQRVVTRRTELEHELAAEAGRRDAEARAMRERVGQYERELEGFLAQLAAISDPAAFAAAAKRMPRPPSLESEPSPTAPSAPVGAAPVAGSRATTEAAASTPPEPSASTPAAPGVTEPSSREPAQDEALAARLAELDAALPGDATPAPDRAGGSEPAATVGDVSTTEIVVKGLGSFGAITGFRQALAGVDGIEGVALSLGQSGEFLFRATHRAGFDVAGAIVRFEGEAASVQPRPDGGLVVTIERGR